ncbi:MAG: hypothetical protein AAFR47_11465 [Pseudomonadota bacterium]
MTRSIAWLVVLSVAACSATGGGQSVGASQFAQEFKVACLDTYPTFQGAEARILSLGYEETETVQGQYSRPDIDYRTSPRFNLRRADGERSACVGALPTRSEVEEGVEALQALVPLETLGTNSSIGTRLTFEDSSVSVSRRSAQGVPLLIFLVAEPR